MNVAEFDIETTGIDPLSYQVVAIGLGDKIITDKYEEKILLKFSDRLPSIKSLIGWRIRTFDIPFIKIRGLKYRIKLDFSNVKVVDLFEEFMYFPVRISSVRLADFLGIEHHEEHSSQIPQLYMKGDMDAVIKHLKADLKLVRRLYEILKVYW